MTAATNAPGIDGRPLPLHFVTSATHLSGLPHTAVEIAIVGRSNVGKSSLINALAHRRDLAKTSNTPGRTQLINLFSLGPPPAVSADGSFGAISAGVVDLPGYGYSSAPKRVRSAWQPMIEGYLLGRSQLGMIVVLVDGEIGPTKLDLQMLAWLQDAGLPHSVVVTKHDKVKPSRRMRRMNELAAGCEVPAADLLWVSAAKGTGIDRLRQQARHWLTPSPAGGGETPTGGDES